MAEQADPISPLSELGRAAVTGDVATVRRLLAAGHVADGTADEGGTPLWRACASDASDAARLAIVDLLLRAGASPRRDDAGETALHAAAARGPVGVVDRLIRGGALEWQADRAGQSALVAAQRGTAADRAAIVELLDRPVIRDPSFRAAVAAIQAGDAAGLARLLDREPRLLRERIREPACYREAERPQYFGDPKLFWFIANNPRLVERLPDTIDAVVEVMLARGVDQADRDYALELVMTSAAARAQGVQDRLIACLLAAGAVAGERAIDMALAHREVAPVRALLAAGLPCSLAIAAALGDVERMAALLPEAAADQVQRAFGLAVINRQREAVRAALDAGADPDGALPVHGHSRALHQAVLDDELEMIELLVERRAALDARDTLWNGTPLDWAVHQNKERARARLAELNKQNPRTGRGSGSR